MRRQKPKLNVDVFSARGVGSESTAFTRPDPVGGQPVTDEQSLQAIRRRLWTDTEWCDVDDERSEKRGCVESGRDRDHAYGQWGNTLSGTVRE